MGDLNRKMTLCISLHPPPPHLPIAAYLLRFIWIFEFDREHLSLRVSLPITCVTTLALYSSTPGLDCYILNILCGFKVDFADYLDP